MKSIKNFLMALLMALLLVVACSNSMEEDKSKIRVYVESTSGFNYSVYLTNEVVVDNELINNIKQGNLFGEAVFYESLKGATVRITVRPLTADKGIPQYIYISAAINDVVVSTFRNASVDSAELKFKLTEPDGTVVRNY